MASMEDSVLVSELRPQAPRGKAEDKFWIPVTKLGHLVKDMKIKFLKVSFLPIKESEIIDFSLGVPFKDEFLKIMLV